MSLCAGVGAERSKCHIWSMTEDLNEGGSRFIFVG